MSTGIRLSVKVSDLTHLHWRAARAGDLPDMVSMLSAIATFDDTSQRWSLEDLEAWHERSVAGAEPGPMLLGFDESAMVAVAWNTVTDGGEPSVRLDGVVHPAFRHQGIGRAVLEWQQTEARSWHAAHGGGLPLRMLGFSDATMVGKRHLYRRMGLQPVRWFIDMVCQFPPPQRVADLLRTPALGVAFRPLTDDLIEATRDAHNEAFADRFGSEALGPQEWAASLGRESARPDLSWVAVDERGRVVGYALNSVLRNSGSPGLGWTDRLGVRPSHRGRNIARILLARSLDSFHRAGFGAGGAGLDSVDGGGTDLYRSLGYQPSDTIIQFELVEPSTTKGRA